MQHLLFGQSIPLAKVFDFQGEEIGGNQARIRMPYNSEFTNSRGDIHGGAISALFDCSLACSVRAISPLEIGVITIDMTIQYLRSCKTDVIVLAKCDQRGRNICFARAEAFDVEGNLLATASGTFKMVERQVSGKLHE